MKFFIYGIIIVIVHNRYFFQMDISKGIIPVGVILKVEADPSDSKVFHISTKGGRKYIFNAESPEDKLFWIRTLQVGIMVNEVRK